MTDTGQATADVDAAFEAICSNTAVIDSGGQLRCVYCSVMVPVHSPAATASHDADCPLAIVAAALRSASGERERIVAWLRDTADNIPVHWEPDRALRRAADMIEAGEPFADSPAQKPEAK